MSKNEQKVLDFMIENPQIDYLAKDIEKGAKISKAGANLALRSLEKQGFFNKEEKGNIFIYSINFSDPKIKELKRINNINKLGPLVKNISQVSTKIILFGSASRGENLADSDFDLFILSSEPEKTKEVLNKNNKLQAIIKTPVEEIEFRRENPVLAEEIKQGIVLWQQL